MEEGGLEGKEEARRGEGRKEVGRRGEGKREEGMDRLSSILIRIYTSHIHENRNNLLHIFNDRFPLTSRP